MKPAFFLDRDGTINIDRVYINDPVLIDLIPGAGQAIRKAQAAGFLIVVVTNQSGIGRGIIEPKVMPQIHKRLDELLAQEGAKVDLYQICIHAPRENCDCRKPSPKLVLDAQKKLNIDLDRSIFVGDKLSDVAAGKRAKCKYSILVRSGKGENEENLTRNGQKVADEEIPDQICDDLTAAVDWSLLALASSKKDSSIE